MISQQEHDFYYEQGYMIVRNVFSDKQVKDIQTGVQRIIERAKAGKSSDIPWINKEKGIPERLSDIFKPEFLQPEIADTLEKSPIVHIIEQLLEGSIRYSLAGMLAGGDAKGYAMDWHRDTIPCEGTSQVRLLLKDVRRCCQINAPLYNDHYLKIVPGSHIRPVTEKEQNVLKHHPKGEMPGELTVELAAGDVVFYYPNLLHTGYNPEGNWRWTLHYAFWRDDAPQWSLEQRQFEWVKQTDLKPYGPQIRTLLERFMNAPTQ